MSIMVNYSDNPHASHINDRKTLPYLFLILILKIYLNREKLYRLQMGLYKNTPKSNQQILQHQF